MSHTIDSTEKRIIAIALGVSAVHLGLIAFAAIKLGIGVPDCVRDVKPFTSGSLIHHGGNRYEAHVLAKMWGFEPRKIVVPTGSVVDFYLTSKDVTHGFHIGDTNVNLMAVPFVVNRAQAKFDRPGEYPILCHEYCGAGHQAMNALIEVRDDVSEGSAEGVLVAVHPGRKVMEAKGCVACHSVDGAPGVGPTFKGIWGNKVEFTDGSSLVVDAPYVKESILKPQAKIVKGFGPVMPTLPVTDQEVDQVTEYIKTLK